MSIEKTFRIIATPTEAGLSAEQTLVYNAGDLAFWLDPSDETTYAEIPNGETPASTPTVRRLIEKAYSASVRFKKKAVADVDAPINRVYFARQGLDLLTGYVYTNGNPLQPSAIDVSSQLTPGSFSVFATVSAKTTLEPTTKIWLLACRNSVNPDYSNPSEADLLNDALHDPAAGATLGIYLRQLAGLSANQVELVIMSGNPSLPGGSEELVVPINLAGNQVEVSPGVNVTSPTSVLSVVSSSAVDGSTSTIQVRQNDTLLEQFDITYDVPNSKADISRVVAGTNSLATNFTLPTYHMTAIGAGRDVVFTPPSTRQFPRAQSPFGEVLVYRGAVDATNRVNLTDYLIDKWSLIPQTLSLGENLLDNSLSPVTFPQTRINQPFAMKVSAPGGAYLDIETVSASAGSGWTTSKVTSPHWNIEGLSPVTPSFFYIRLTAWNYDESQSVTRDYLVTTTVDLNPTQDQVFVRQLSVPAIWLDPSDSYSRVGPTNAPTGLRDKANAALWTISSSEVPRVDTASFSKAGLAFSSVPQSSGISAGLTLNWPSYSNDSASTDDGVRISDVDGNSVFAAVFHYTAPEVPGQAVGWHALSSRAALTLQGNAYPNGTDERTFGARSLYAEDVGLDDLRVEYYLESAASFPGQVHRIQSDKQLRPGERAIVIWEYENVDAMTPTYRIHVVRQTTEAAIVSYTIDGVASQDTPPSAPDFVGRFTSLLASTPGVVGEQLVFRDKLSPAEITQLRDYLTLKWMANAASAATITAPAVRVTVPEANYSMLVTITNGTNHVTTASVNASAGSGWTIRQVTPSDYTQWIVAGTAPADLGDFTLTVSAEVDFLQSSQAFNVTVLEKPAAASIGELRPPQALAGGQYTGSVFITGLLPPPVGMTQTVSVFVNGGSSWQITRDPNMVDRFWLTGEMPEIAQNLTATIEAVNYIPDGSDSTAVSRSFTIRAVTLDDQRTTTYQLDITGLLVANRVKREKHTLTPKNGRDRQMVVPTYAPFFGDGLVVEYIGPGNQMVKAREGVDYLAVYQFQDLSQITTTPVHGAVGFLNLGLTGTIYLSYNTLGGNFVSNRNELYVALMDRILNPRQIEFASIIDLPSYFPVSQHKHDAQNDLVGFNRAITALTTASAVVAENQVEPDIAQLLTHAGQTGNPHGLTAAQVGMERAPNFPPATVDNAIDPLNETTLLTPMTASAAAKANLRAATSVQTGVAQLNTGTEASDVNNSTDFLTAAGAIELMLMAGNSEFKNEFSGGQVRARISPWPAAWPLYWRGIRYSSAQEFVAAVSTLVDIHPIQFDSVRGILYFPQGSQPPLLNLASILADVQYRDRSMSEPMSMPMKVPVVDESTGYVGSGRVVRLKNVMDDVTKPLSILVT